MCRVLGVNRTSFHDWERRPPSDHELYDAFLTDKIRQVHAAAGGTYGSPRVHAELRLQYGIRVGKKRVERLMAAAGLEGIPVPRKTRTTVRVAGVRCAPDLVERDFKAEAPNRLWCADITYLRSWEGWLYLASVLDCFSRLIVGWCMLPTLRLELVERALEMAVARRRPDPGLIHHSDHGSQPWFNRSSQHLSERSCDGSTASEVRSSRSAGDVLAGSSVGGASRGASAVLGGDRSRCVDGGCGRGSGSVGSGWRPVVPRGWRDANCHPGAVVRASPVIH